MNIYLDDDMDANELIGFLEHEGHEVISPRRVAMRGAQDEPTSVGVTNHV